MSGGAISTEQASLQPIIAYEDRDEPTASPVSDLTAIQRQCLELTLEHKSSKEIAQVLGATQHSVDWHLRVATRKLGANSRRAAAIILRDSGVVAIHKQFVHKSPELVAAPMPMIVDASPSEWSDHNVPATACELHDESSAEDWPPATIMPDHSVHDRGPRIVPWGTRNTLRIEQRLILIILIAGLSAVAFGSIIGSFETLRHLF